MQGLSGISEKAIADASASNQSAGTAVGAAVVVGVPLISGIKSAAGHAVGAALVNGHTFITGSALASGTQLFDFSVDLLQALLWQYDMAKSFQTILEGKQKWYDDNQQAFWEDWFHDVFDLRTADDFGCAVWSIILRLPLNIIYVGTDGNNWGFDPFHSNFDRGNFSTASTIVIPLTLAQKRLVLQLRYYQLITRGQVPDINRNFARIFADFGPAYVIDNNDMTMTYVFDFVVSSPLAFILKFYKLLPAPAGVKVDFVQQGQSGGRSVGAAVVRGVT